MLLILLVIVLIAMQLPLLVINTSYGTIVINTTTTTCSISSIINTGCVSSNTGSISNIATTSIKATLRCNSGVALTLWSSGCDAETGGTPLH